MSIFTLPSGGGGPVILFTGNTPVGTTQINFPVGGTVYTTADMFGGSAPIANNVIWNNLATTNSAVIQITLSTASVFSAAAHTFTGVGTGWVINLIGSSGNDDITGTSINCSIYTGNGDDTIRVNIAQTGGVINGEAGTDTLVFDRSTSVVSETIFSTTSIEKFTATGGAGNDNFSGLNMVDTLTGGSGDDTIRGDATNVSTSLTSATGGDILVGGLGTDLAVFGVQSIASNITFDVASQATSTVVFADGTSLIGFEAVTMYSGSGADSLTGGAFNDTLLGNGGNDTLDGGLGRDALDGGAGDDELRSLAGNNGEFSYFGGSGTDLLIVDRTGTATAISYNSSGFSEVGGGGSITGIERFSLTGGNGDDTFAGGVGNDTFIGGAGNDFIELGTSGADSANGGAGAGDVLYVDRSVDSTALLFNVGLIGATAYTFIGGATAINFERVFLVSGSGADSLMGGLLNDTLNGGSGDDTIDGSGGIDFLNGGLGNDKLIINKASLTAAVTATAGSSATVFLADGTQISNFEIFDFETGSGNDILVGGAFADRLIGNAGRDALTGGAGNDSLYGGLGNDTLDAGDGVDLVLGGDGFDSIDAGAGDDLIAGGTGSDTIQSGDGADFVYGGSEGDLVDGGDGGDILLGELGNDTIFGGNGADYLFGGTGLNVLDGGAGLNIFNSEGIYDVMQGGDDGNKFYRLAAGSSLTTGGLLVDEFVGGAVFSNDSVYGGDGNDYLYGGSGDDLLVGEGGFDVIVGQAGRDTMDGGAGVNLLWANDEGVDQIRVNAFDGGTQVVEFFNAGMGSNVDVLRLIASGITSMADYNNLVANAGSVVGTNLLVNAATGVQIYMNVGAVNQSAVWLQGVSMTSMQADNFLFG